MQALETLGLKLKEEIGLAELLSENFNPQLYGLTKVQKEKVNALRDVVATYMNIREEMVGKTIRRSEDAVELDTSYMTIPEVVEAMQKIVAEKVGE